MYIKINMNIINLKTETNNLANIFDDVLHREKYKIFSPITYLYVKIDNSTNSPLISIIAILNTFTMSLSRLTFYPSTTAVSTQHRKYNLHSNCS